MYKLFYKLDKKPFEMNPDHSFLWLGEKHNEAFSALRYGIDENKGFLLLTGDAGSGKTTLVRALTESLGKDVEWAVITDPRLERIDFYNAIAKGFGIGQLFTSKVQFLIQFSQFLHKADDQKKKVLLLVDDCHRLTQEMLEELRLLSNIEKADTKLINIFFVGQPAFKELLVEPRNRAVRQRLALKAELPALDASETDDYIRHRLKVAGTEEKLFTEKAVQAVHRAAQGIPRRINAICDHALLSGAEQARKTIGNKLIESCIQNMDKSVKLPQEDSVAPLAEKAVSFSGFVLEIDNQYSWLKYGLGLLAIGLVGIYFWFPAQKSLESAQKATVQITKVPAVKSVSQVSSSPAVTMLEKNEGEINAKKAAELKTAILEKAYSNNGKKQDTIYLQAEETVAGISAPAKGVDQQVDAADADKMASVSEPIVSDQAVDSKQAIVQEKTVPVDSASDDTDALQKEVSERAIKASSVELLSEKESKPEIARMAPMEPRKIILGLQPNALKLTNAARKEFDSFVEKLKLYPQATILVKGFVSAKSNSLENIELSEDRAMSVQKLFLAKGIDVEKIEVMGMGNLEPIASNKTSEGRRKNRRVEVVVVNDGILDGGGD